jgi:hypothetical protein
MHHVPELDRRSPSAAVHSAFICNLLSVTSLSLPASILATLGRLPVCDSAEGVRLSLVPVTLRHAACFQHVFPTVFISARSAALRC